MMNRYKDPQITHSVGTVPTANRHHLAHQIEKSLGDDRSIVKTLDEALNITGGKLRIMEESEQFLGTRIRKYRKLLAEHQMRINGEEIGITNDEKERHLKQQDQLQLKICDVIDTHKSILREVEILRRKINDLERKRDDLKSDHEQCEEFLIASAKLDLDGDYDDAADMEMGVLKHIEPSHLEIS